MTILRNDDGFTCTTPGRTKNQNYAARCTAMTPWVEFRISRSIEGCLTSGMSLLTNRSLKSLSNQSRSWEPFHVMPLLALCTLFDYACAVPIHESSTRDSSTVFSTETHQLYRRETSSAVWIPLVTVGAFTGLLVLWALWRRRKQLLGFLRNRIPIQIGTTEETRELTADQLAGTINNAGSGNQNNAGATRTRRGRRPRRTPSQVSTHSLPTYAKEPGEQELVVLQGPAEEDVPIAQPLAIVVNLDEDADSGTNSRPDSQYRSVPNASAATPLLREDTTSESSEHPVQSSATDLHQRSGSIATGNTSADSISLALVDSHDTESDDPRGEAPAYFEVVGPDTDSGVIRSPLDAGSQNAPASPVPDDSVSPPTPPQPSTSRRSGFRSLLHRMSVAGSPGHARNFSSGSASSSNRAHNRGPSANSILSTFNPLSRQKSFASNHSSRLNLTSPSLISLNSISAPLTHTAIRTEFTYPRSGPTPDQLRLISSRENVTRFGVPYGPDAVAFASLSAVNLASGERPPEFETLISGNGSGSRGGEATPVAAGEASATSGGEGDRSQETTTAEESIRDSMTSGSSTSALPDGLPAQSKAAETATDGIPVTNGSLTGPQDRDEEEEGKEWDGKEKEVVASTDNVTSVEGNGKEGLPLEQNLPLKEKEDGASGSRLESTGTSEASSSPEKASVETTMTLKPTAEITQEVLAIEIVSATPISISASSPSATQESTSGCPSPPPIPPSLSKATKKGPTPPTSYHPPPQPAIQPDSDIPTRERTESRASQRSYLSYASHISNVSNGTFRTAAESVRSRKGGQWTTMTDDEDDDTAAGYDTADDGDVTEGDEGSRPSTPTQSDRTRHGRKSTDTTVTQLTPVSSRVKQDRHMSTATIHA